MDDEARIGEVDTGHESAHEAIGRELLDAHYAGGLGGTSRVRDESGRGKEHNYRPQRAVAQDIKI